MHLNGESGGERGADDSSTTLGAFPTHAIEPPALHFAATMGSLVLVMLLTGR